MKEAVAPSRLYVLTLGGEGCDPGFSGAGLQVQAWGAVVCDLFSSGLCGSLAGVIGIHGGSKAGVVFSSTSSFHS